jgi:hypothetical protein
VPRLGQRDAWINVVEDVHLREGYRLVPGVDDRAREYAASGHRDLDTRNRATGNHHGLLRGRMFAIDRAYRVSATRYRTEHELAALVGSCRGCVELGVAGVERRDSHTSDQRAALVELVTTTGMTIAAAAAQVGVHSSTASYWIRQAAGEDPYGVCFL